jgi:hypothetical protein
VDEWCRIEAQLCDGDELLVILGIREIGGAEGQKILVLATSILFSD